MSFENYTAAEFVHKTQHYKEIEDRITTKVLDGSEDVLSSISLPYEDIAQLTPTEDFTYQAMQEQDTVSYTASREEVQLWIDEAENTKEYLRGLLAFTEPEGALLGALLTITAESETPITDILQSSISDEFFELMDILDTAIPDSGLMKKIIYLYLAETGFLQSELSTSDEVAKHRSNMFLERLLKDRDFVVAYVAAAISTRLIQDMITQRLIPEDHFYDGVMITSPTADNGNEPQLTLSQIPLSATFATGPAETRVHVSYREHDGELLKGLSIETYDKYMPSREVRRKGPTILSDVERAFASQCLDAAINAANALDAMNLDELKSTVMQHATQTY